MTIRFEPGTVVVTVGALEAASRTELMQLVNRHLAGNWGDVDAEDAQSNEEAVKHGFRILSSYRSKSGEKLWVISEADRSQTTVMTPGEY